MITTPAGKAWLRQELTCPGNIRIRRFNVRDCLWPFCFAVVLVFSGCPSQVEEQAEETLDLAYQAAQEGDWKTADEYFHETVLLKPEKAEAWMGWGFTLHNLGETELAEESFQEALKLFTLEIEKGEPTPGSILNKGFVLVILGRKDEAVSYVTSMQERFPEANELQNFHAVAENIEQNWPDWFRQHSLPANKIR